MIKAFFKLSFNQQITISLSFLAIATALGSVWYTRKSVQEQKNANISSRQVACKSDFREFANSARKEYYNLLLGVGQYENSKQSIHRQEFLNSVASLINLYDSTIQSAVVFKCDQRRLITELNDIQNIKNELLYEKPIETKRIIQYREELPILQNQFNVCCSEARE